MPSKTVDWSQWEGSVGCPLESCTFDNVNADGVYIIWYEANWHYVVYVGQGDIASRLNKHKQDPQILHYRKDGPLLVTWAAVPPSQKDGVERYLADQLRPLEGRP